MPDPIVCYGATGYTGRLVVQALEDRGAEIALAGRNGAKLRELRKRLDLDADVRPASADDDAALDGILADASAVVNTAGPFLEVGDGVARAAVRAGLPYVDSTGEQVYAHRLREDLDEAARDTGAVLAPMLAFEYAPGDLCAAELLGDRSARRLDVTYRIDHGVASAGTRKSILEVSARTGWTWRDGRLLEEPPAKQTRTVRIDDRELSAYSFPGGEVLTVPRHADVGSVRTFMTAHPKTIARLRRWGPVARAALKGPIRGLAHLLVDVRHEDPTRSERTAARGRVRLEAKLQGGDVERYAFDCRDPYALTGELLAEGAERLARGEDDVAGVVAPAELFDAGTFLGAVRKRHETMSWGPEHG